MLVVDLLQRNAACLLIPIYEVSRKSLQRKPRKSRKGTLFSKQSALDYCQMATALTARVCSARDIKVEETLTECEIQPQSYFLLHIKYLGTQKLPLPNFVKFGVICKLPSFPLRCVCNGLFSTVSPPSAALHFTQLKRLLEVSFRICNFISRRGCHSTSLWLIRCITLHTSCNSEEEELPKTVILIKAKKLGTIFKPHTILAYHVYNHWYRTQ